VRGEPLAGEAAISFRARFSCLPRERLVLFPAFAATVTNSEVEVDSWRSLFDTRHLAKAWVYRMYSSVPCIRAR
jgi:hypothetical protein